MIGHSVLTRFVNCKFKSKIGKKLSNYTLGVIELPLLTLRSCARRLHGNAVIAKHAALASHKYYFIYWRCCVTDTAMSGIQGVTPLGGHHDTPACNMSSQTCVVRSPVK